MRLSRGYWQTYKETPNDAEIPSHILMMRAGLINKQASGLYTFMPMMMKSLQKIKTIIREELDKAGCHEVAFPVVTDGNLWKESGRWDSMGPLMLKMKDRAERDLCMSPTAEEPSTDLFKSTIKSYKQLPVTMYQINTKFRDEIRPRYGIMRCREFIMKDGYSFHADKACLDEVYDDLYTAYNNIFSRMGLEFIPVEADGGAMADGDQKTHEFQVVADAGEDELIYCETGKYAANVEKAITKRADIELDGSQDPIKKVETRDKSTIADVCELLGQPHHHSLKALAYKGVKDGEEEFVVLFVLGDDSLNEIKLTNFLGADHLAPMTDTEMLNLGLVKGYIGPHEISDKVRLLIDEAVNVDKAYTAGANEEHYHFTNLIPSRDAKNYEVADFRLAQAGDICEATGGKVVTKRGIEVGHIFQLGDKYSKAMNATVLDKNGKAVNPLMGCYGIGVTRIVGAAIEQHHDDNGIIWPKAIAPFHVYFGLIGKSDEYKEMATEIYNEFRSAGIETLLDDRGVGAGFMFKDSDLIGLPVRVVLGERDHKKTGEFEIKVRRTGESFKVKREELLSKLQEVLSKVE